LIDDLGHIDDVAMFKEEPYHPVTKSGMKGAGKLDCSVDTRYETGIIICNEKGKKLHVSTTILIAVTVFIACIFIFSLKFEIKNVTLVPVLQLIFFNPIVIVVAFSTVVAVILARKSR